MKSLTKIATALALAGVCLTAHARTAGCIDSPESGVFTPYGRPATAAEPATSKPEPVAANSGPATVNPGPEAATTESAAADTLTVNSARAGRGLVSTNNTFVPKGQWLFGGSASYSTHTNNDYTFVVFEGIDSDGYTFKVSPLVGYAVRDNMALGVRFIYGRNLLKVLDGEINLGDEESGTHIAADYYYSLKHSYSVAAVWRQYIPLGRNKRFALFNEVSLAVGGHQAKFAADTPLRGTYETGYEVSLGVSPGLIAFATNTLAVEINVGVMGISYNSSHQVQNRVQTADVKSSFMNFKVNLLSIGLGVSFYL